MQSIYIRSENGRVSVVINGVALENLHSFSVDYIKGAPLQIACVADLTDGKKRGKDYLS